MFNLFKKKKKSRSGHHRTHEQKCQYLANQLLEEKMKDNPALQNAYIEKWLGISLTPRVSERPPADYETAAEFVISALHRNLVFHSLFQSLPAELLEEGTTGRSLIDSIIELAVKAALIKNEIEK